MATLNKGAEEELAQTVAFISKPQVVRPRRQWPWKVADCTLCIFVFFPSMVFYWRGIWDLLGVYIYPDNEPLCHWVITGIGSCTILSYGIFPLLTQALEGSRKSVYVLVTRTFMFIHGDLSMTYWRGVWMLGDYYLLQYGWVG